MAEVGAVVRVRDQHPWYQGKNKLKKKLTETGNTDF